jgi:hypothetical protein
MKKSTGILIVAFAGIIFLFYFMGGGKGGFKHGFYTADFPEYGNTNDWYVASNAGVGGA